MEVYVPKSNLHVDAVKHPSNGVIIIYVSVRHFSLSLRFVVKSLELALLS